MKEKRQQPNAASTESREQHDEQEPRFHRFTIREALQLLLIPLNLTLNLLLRNPWRTFGASVTAIIAFWSNQSRVPNYRIQTVNENESQQLCTECVDCEIKETTRNLLTNIHAFMIVDKEINDNLRFIRQGLVVYTMSDRITQLSGSVRDGASIAKWFSRDSSKREIEVDLQHIAMIFDTDEKHLISMVETKGGIKMPDNLKIRTDKHTIETKAIPKLHKVLNELCNNNDKDCMDLYNTEYLNPQLFKRVGAYVYRFRDSHNSHLHLAAALLGTKVEEFSSEIAEEAPAKGTALTTRLKLRHIKTGQIFLASMDNVLVIHCNFWPDVASDFSIRRSRKSVMEQPKWPSMQQRLDIMSEGCDIAPKPSPDGDLNSEWRWSFGNAEGRLMEALSSNQKRTYFVVKIIFYRYVKSIDSDKIHSYWIKTVMFWFAEENPSTDNIWCDENLIKSVQRFYEEFLSMIQTWELPHFIIPSHSLLRYTDRTLKPALEKRISEIVDDIETYIPTTSDFLEVQDLLKGSRAIIEGLVSYAQETRGSHKDHIEEVRKIQAFSQLLGY